MKNRQHKKQWVNNPPDGIYQVKRISGGDPTDQVLVEAWKGLHKVEFFMPGTDYEAWMDTLGHIKGYPTITIRNGRAIV